MDKTLIIDGHNYLYSSYYGIPSAAKLPNGLQVNAYYGFMSLLRKSYRYISPKNIIVMFDSETGIKSKIEEHHNYKQNREYVDTDMFKQLPMIKDALNYINIHYIEHPNYEADDVIGTIALKKSEDGEVYISSQDKDFSQLINNNIFVLRKEKGKFVKYNPETFLKKYNFDSNRYLEYLCLVGDSSDNIKGVKGIGKKTALKLIKKNDHILEEKGNPLLLKGKKKLCQNLEFLGISTELDIDFTFKEVDEERLDMSSNDILKELSWY
jgi:DNA polymerase-1